MALTLSMSRHKIHEIIFEMKLVLSIITLSIFSNHFFIYLLNHLNILLLPNNIDLLSNEKSFRYFEVGSMKI